MDIKNLIEFPVSEITISDADVQQVWQAVAQWPTGDFSAFELDAAYVGFGDESKATLILLGLQKEGIIKPSYGGGPDRRRWRRV